MSVFPHVEVETVMHDGKECYVDIFRKRLTLTLPEEEVRQSVLRRLVDELHVPLEKILVEEPMCHFEKGNRGRADIVILGSGGDIEGMPIAVIECKARDYYLTERAFDQAIPYCEATGADYLICTTGDDAYIMLYDWDEEVWRNLEEVPTYEQMCEGYGVMVKKTERKPWVPYDDLSAHVQEYVDDGTIGENTDRERQEAAVRLIDLLFRSPKYADGTQLGNILIDKDFGAIEWDFGNCGRGFPGTYRSFQVRYHRDVRFAYIGISNYNTIQRSEMTSLHIGSHGAGKMGMDLHVVLEKHLHVEPDAYTIIHSGDIRQKGQEHLRRKLEALMQKRRKDMLRGNEVFIARLPRNEVLTMEHPAVKEMFENLIEYGLIRAEVRGRG